MSAELYAAACAPARWKILGRRLCVFTVGHAQLLDQIAFNSAEVSPVDLLVAIKVCSMPYPRGQKYLARGGWTLRDRTALFAFRLRPSVFDHAVRTFQRYLDDSKASPRYFADDKKTKACTCPAILMMKRDLMNYYGYSAEEVMSLPFGQAEWERLAIIEAQGGLDFRTAEDDDLEAQALIAAKEWAEEEAAKNGAR